MLGALCAQLNLFLTLKKASKDDLSNNGMARPAEIMSLKNFKIIASKFKPYVDRIRFLSLHGCGEPLR